MPVAGCVADVKTGQPLAGVGVQSVGHWKGVVSDAAGKYRLEGLPLGESELFIVPPPKSRYLPGGVAVTTTASTPTLVRDIALTAGVLVRGRAIDETTGKPVAGTLEYFAYETNPHRQKSDSLRQTVLHTEFPADADGRFEIPVLPGQGILGFRTGTNFPRGVGADQIDCAQVGGGRGGNAIAFRTAPTICTAFAYNLVVPLNPQSADTELAVNLKLRSTGTDVDVPGRVLSPDGRPLRDYLVSGARKGVVWAQNPGERFTIMGYDPAATRRLFVYHPGDNLAGHYDLKGEPPQQLEITLQPAGTLVGRVLEPDGTPWAHTTILQGRDTIPANGNPPPPIGRMAYSC